MDGDHGRGRGHHGRGPGGGGGEQSFGLNIRLPFEQEANAWIASDPKLITFKYFFTRKLFLVKEASALALLPGGFGTMDEAFEVLTLMQTGKAAIIPMVMIEAGPQPYWSRWEEWVRGTLVAQRLIDPRDTAFYRIVASVEEAVRGGDALLSRLPFGPHRRREPRLPPAAPARLPPLSRSIQDRFADICKGPDPAGDGPDPA